MQVTTGPVYGNLFDGRTLTGWRATGNASIWTVKDGAIVGINDKKKSGSKLYTKTNYEDFDLTLKVMWTGIVDFGGLLPFGIPVATLGSRLLLLHIRMVLCSPVPSVAAVGCNNFCRCPSLVGHPVS